ncbi:MAG: dihydrolipoyl dehydrogenase [Tissierella sp.]|uniref:dihydrolipoyl dehydrogenase n=1 Tax=Tissierella sp. TaxID=41274 RepID=UPI003F9B0894
MEKYDVIIIGGGPGGYVSGIKSAQLGLKVAVVEDGNLGGVCLNWGCIPTKTMLTTGKKLDQIRNAKEFAIEGIDEDKVHVDWKALLERKDDVVGKLVNGIRMLFKKNKVDLIEGFAKVKDKTTIEVDGKTLKTKNIVIATGAKEGYPEIDGLKEMHEKGNIIYSKTAFDLEEVPKDLVIIGGSQYSIEFANLFNLLGSRVTIVQKYDKVLPFVEKEAAKTLERKLKKDGVKFVTKSEFKNISEDGLVVEVKGKEKVFKGDKYLISWLPEPNIKGLEALDLKKDDRGFIETDETMKTNIDNVYAIGDVNGKYSLAHVASAEGIVVAERLSGKDSTMDYNLVPLLIYTQPELASIGLTESQAKDKGMDVTSSKFLLAANGKAMSEGDSVGFIKIISDNKYGEIVGTHIVANDAGNMISNAASIMQLEGTIYDMAKTILPHPTTSEIFLEAAFGAIDKPIHM